MEEKSTMDKEKAILPDITNIKTQDTFTLPSKGLVYDKTDKIGSSLTLRRMTTKEDKMRMRNEYISTLSVTFKLLFCHGTTLLSFSVTLTNLWFY